MPFIERIAIQELTTIPNDSGVIQKKLPQSGALYELEIKLQWTNGATHAQDATIFDAFDLIEIVAGGSNYIFSGTPFELYQLNAYWYKELPFMVDRRVGATSQQVILKIPFMAMMNDYTKFLPLAAWSDIEVRLHYSPTIAATDGFATGTGQYSIYAKMSYDNGLGNGSGYLRYRTVENYTTVGSGVKVFEIVGNNPLLGLMVNVSHATANLGAAFSKVEVTLNDGNKKIFTAVPADYARMLAREWGIDLDFSLITAVSNTDSTVLVGFDVQVAGIEPVLAAPTIGTTLLPHYILQPITSRTITVSAYNDTADGAATAQVAYTTDNTVLIHGKYVAVPDGFLIPFGLNQPVQNMIIPDNVSRMKLELTDATASIVTRLGQLEIAQVA